MNPTNGQGKKSAKATSFYAGIIVLFAFISAGIGLSNIWPQYIDVPSFMITFSFIIGFLLIGSGLGNLIKSICYSVSGKVTSIEGAHAAIVSCGLGAWGAIIGGVVGILIGVINILGQGIDDIYKLSAGLAVALITTLYGVIFAGVFLAFRARIIQALYRQQNKMGEGDLI